MSQEGMQRKFYGMPRGIYYLVNGLWAFAAGSMLALFIVQGQWLRELPRHANPATGGTYAYELKGQTLYMTRGQYMLAKGAEYGAMASLVISLAAFSHFQRKS